MTNRMILYPEAGLICHLSSVICHLSFVISFESKTRMTLQDIQAAKKRIKGGIYYSPCPISGQLSEFAGSQVYCKLDHLQRTGSFKERGARNGLLLLDSGRREKGVVAASAGAAGRAE